jgi:dTDP-4-amino-4,6-dideoxygalactose transaminase
VTVGAHFTRNDVYPIFRRADVPNAEWFSSRVLSLPMFPDLTNEEIHYVVSVIREGW